VLVLHCEPWLAVAVGSGPILLRHLVLLVAARDNVVRQHCPTLDLVSGADKTERRKFEGKLANCLFAEAHRGHDSYGKTCVERHVLPATFDTEIGQIGDAAKVRRL